MCGESWLSEEVFKYINEDSFSGSKENVIYVKGLINKRILETEDYSYGEEEYDFVLENTFFVLIINYLEKQTKVGKNKGYQSSDGILSIIKTLTKSGIPIDESRICKLICSYYFPEEDNKKVYFFFNQRNNVLDIDKLIVKIEKKLPYDTILYIFELFACLNFKPFIRGSEKIKETVMNQVDYVTPVFDIIISYASFFKECPSSHTPNNTTEASNLPCCIL